MMPQNGNMMTAKTKSGAGRLFLLLPVVACSVITLPAAPLRQTINFNREWKFQLGEVTGAETVAFDDARDDANLPAGQHQRCRAARLGGFETTARLPRRVRRLGLGRRKTFGGVVSKNSNSAKMSALFRRAFAMVIGAGDSAGASPFCGDESVCFSGDLRRRLDQPKPAGGHRILAGGSACAEGVVGSEATI